MRKICVILSLIFVLCCFAERVYSFAWPLVPPPEQKVMNVPIIMYHLISQKPDDIGKYGITPAEMEDDLKYLAENGYETVLVADLIKFVRDGKRLPDKPVVLTFDDGRNSDYDYLLPLLAKYEMKAVLSIVGQFADEYSAVDYEEKPHLTWAQICELYNSKHVEIQNHSYNLHEAAGAGRRKGEDMRAYQVRLGKDLLKLQETVTKLTGRAPTAFAYPLGVISKGSEEVLKELNFHASFSCAEGMNIIMRDDPDCLFRLKRNIRRNGQPLSSILKQLEAQSAGS